MTQKFTSEGDHSGASTASGTSGSSSIAKITSTGKDAIQSATRELTGEVSHMASGIADEAKKAAEVKLGAGKDFAVEHLGSVADALRQTSKSLGSDNVATGYIEKAAGSVDSVAEYFQTRTLSQLINDVEGYARREPAVFLGGAFFAGMLGGRLLKAAKPTTQGAGQRGGHVSSGQSRNGNDRQGSFQGQGGRQGGNHDNHAQGQRQGSQQGNGGSGGQGNKQTQGQGGQQQINSASASANAGASTKNGDKQLNGDKPGANASSNEPGQKGSDGSNRSGKGSGVS